MQREARRFTLLVAALLLAAALLAACSTPSAPLPSSSNGGGINVFRTPNPNAASPTPTFPPFTVGAWPSDYSPANNEHMTIYVLCKRQPADMSSPSQPMPGVPVDVYIGAPLNQNISQQGANPRPVTDSSGLAAVQFDLNDPQSGLPVTVQVSVVLGNQTYHAETFFTPNPTAAPTTTPNPNATPSGTATGTPSGTAGP